MENELLSCAEAAKRLGISALTLYSWLSKSDAGEFLVRGQAFSIDYLQGGPNGQGRIQIASAEVDRLQEAMRVRPLTKLERRPPVKQHIYPFITVPLGRPD